MHTSSFSINGDYVNCVLIGVLKREIFEKKLYWMSCTALNNHILDIYIHESYFIISILHI